MIKTGNDCPRQLKFPPPFFLPETIYILSVQFWHLNFITVYILEAINDKLLKTVFFLIYY